MKKFIYLFIAAAVTSTMLSCSDDDTVNRDPNEQFLKISSTDAIADVDAEGSSATITAGPARAEVTFSVESNIVWDAVLESADGNNPWIEVEYNNSEILIILDSFYHNPGDEESGSRSAKIVVGTDDKGFAGITVKQNSAEAGFITTDIDELYFLSGGETQRVYVETSYPSWTFEIIEQTVDWLTVTGDLSGNFLELTAENSFAEEMLYAKILLTAGSGEDRARTEITAYQYDGRMILEYNVPADQLTVYLPLYESIDVLVDFGDGTKPERYTRNGVNSLINMVKHTYEQPGNYEIAISGTATRIYFGSDNAASHKNSLTAIKQWGSLGVTNMEYAFAYCYGLESVAPTFGDAFSEVTSFRYMFYYCTALTDVADGLFSTAVKANRFDSIFNMCTALKTVSENIFENCANASNFTYLFNGCASLGSIPEDLFANNPKIDQMPYLLQRTNLSEIPSGLFRNNPEIINFGSAFREMPNLRTVPEDLFANNPNVLFFDNVFRESGLETVPAGIFSHNRSVTQFQNAFYNCTYLTGESPYTVIDGNKVHLYEWGANGAFVTPTQYSQCFRGCTNLTDYEDIPSAWK